MTGAGVATTVPRVDLGVVDAAVAECGREASAVIPILQRLQAVYRYLPAEALRRVCELTDITPAAIAGVSTFYAQFRHKPVGRHVISVCHGTACHVKGAGLVQDAIQRHLGIRPGEDTDGRGEFTVEQVACLGCCTLAPVIRIDGVTYGHLTPDAVPGTIRDFRDLARCGGAPERPRAAPRPAGGVAEIRVGVGSCCVAGGSQEVRAALEREVAALGVAAVVKPVGCVGMCHQTPLVQVVLPGEEPRTYARMTAYDAARVVRAHFRPRGALRRLAAGVDRALEGLLSDEAREPVSRLALEPSEGPVCAFLGRQRRIASEWCGDLDPLDIDEYEASGGFSALKTCLASRTPEQVIAEVTASGLRGRGGAGFSTGRKWALVRRAAGGRKHIVCNGDEGDPGAFMDRMLLESFPYRVLEGMAIAAWAVGAGEGVLYVRAEYPLALERIRAAISAMRGKGLLGGAAGAGGFRLDLRVVEGAGAFVAGEETALLAAIEGRRAVPGFRPPYPAERGLFGRPTNINNVETYAMVPWIIRNGAAALAAIGTATSTGTKVFSLAGKVTRGGLIEVPMGVTVREVVEEIGGGPPGGRRFKALQIGGPSGGCIPAALADTPVDYEALVAAGAIMGSGGMVVLDEDDCMVDIARYFMSFTQKESCGTCAPCRVGTKRMLEILGRLCEGRGEAGDLERLEDLGRTVQRTSLCGLGKTAPNPVLSTLRHFRAEYEAHLEGRCPARRCRALVSYRIGERCIGCTKCAQACPVGAIQPAPHRRHEVIRARCTTCDACRQVCPTGAVEVVSPPEGKEAPCPG